MATKEQNVYMAKLAEQAERYDEMKDYMKEVSTGQSLSVEERNLLSVAYKNAVGSRRASWRIISSVESKEKQKGNEQAAKDAAAYRQKIETELNEICMEIIKLLSDHLIAPLDAAIKAGGDTGDAPESLVFFQKMKGDYYRYMAEYQPAEDKSSGPANEAKEAYTAAYAAAENSLQVTHPIRLGLALNFSVFHYEVLGSQEEACAMARKAFEDAIAELDNVSEDSYKDSTLIMQLLRDNLTLWTSEDAGQE